MTTPPLSKAEAKVYKYLKRGWQLKRIATTLGIEIKTVKFHCTHIYKKLEVGGKFDLLEKQTIKDKMIHKEETNSVLLPKGECGQWTKKDNI